MMDVTVKTLDGQNRNYSLPETITVRDFKERIANSINIPADTQRLIFHGKVMQDDKMLKDYDVHGKVIHVVQRAPPSARTTASTTSSSSTATGATAGGTGPGGSSVLVGSFTLPSEVLDPNQVQNIVQQAIAGMGDNWRNARVSTRASTDGSSLDVHINLGQVPASALANGAQLRLTQARQMLDIAREAVNKLEAPPGEQQAENMEGQDENQNRQQPPATSDSNEESDMDTSSPSGAAADSTSQSEAKEKTPAANSQSQAKEDTQATSSQSEAREDTPAADSQSEVREDTPAADSASNQANGQQRRDTEAPRLTSMSDLLGDVMELHGRLQPHVARLRDLMAEDMELQNDQVQEPQRMYNLVSEALHAISHTYHNLSDLMVDMATPPPRRMYTAPTQPLMPGIPHQGIPVRAQFSVGSPRLVRRTVTTTQPRQEASTPQSGTTTSATVTSSSSSSTTTTSQSNVPPSSTGSIGPLPPGFLSGTGNNPYVYVEVGPDSVTVNSISTQIIGNDSSSNGDRQRNNGTTGTTSASSSSTTTTTSSTTTGGATPSAPPPPIPGLTGMNIPGLPPDMMQNIISSVLHQHGHRQGQPVQINVVPVPMSSLGGQMPGGINITRVLNPAAMSATPPTSAPTSSASQSSPATTTTSSASTTASTSASATATGSASTTSAGASSTAQASATASTTTTTGPRLAPAMMLDGVPRPVDPYLPCNSHHFLAQRTRNMATQTSQGPENALSDMVSNLMNGLLGNVHQGPPRSAPASVAPGGPTSTHPAHGTASSRATTHTTFSQPGSIPANPFASLLQGTFGPMLGPRAPAPPSDTPGSPPVPPMMQMLRDMLQSANPQSQQPAAGQPAGQGDRPAPTPAPGVMSDDAFTRLVSGIGSYMSRAATGEQEQDTVHDFLSTLGDSYSSGTGEGFINEIFQCLSRHITFSDLFQIFFGHPEPLNRLRTPLQEFITRRVLRGAEYSEASLQEGVEQVMLDMDSEIQEAVAVVTVKEGIDLKQSLRDLFRQNLVKICRQVMESPVNDADFGPHLHARVRRMLEEFVVLTPDCLVEGAPGLERMLHSRLRNLTAGMNPLIQQWMVTMTSQQLHNFREDITVSQSDVQQYLVRGTAAPAKPCSKERSESPMETEAAAEGASAAPSQKPAIPPKPTGDRKPRTSSTPVSATLERGKRSFMNGAGSDGASPSHSASPTSPPTDEDDSWQAVLPADWVPIINRDITRQRENGAPRPLSDIYMQGLPPKRRRMMALERGSNLNNMAEYIPDSIIRAAAAAGVQPISSQENLSNEASEESELQHALEEEVQRVLTQRLQNDSDYNSDKFPSSKEFFKHGDRT
ncbi:large proline-rich protein BAG6-like isoform X2 [Haliotis rufescens]|uniref:large proline-rich protein BAG6-like isoform X2 n=1 Tax=Haliotis rufescens TaxID=6454 RepID=UPI00201F96E8|nr:large proline-rich protein BAG6-like isoform X2 [Haliotis rufescens]